MRKSIFLAVAMVGASAFAQQSQVFRPDSMSPEQQMQMRAAVEQRQLEMRRQWEAMTPEQKEQVRLKLALHREEAERRINALPPEQREKMRSQLQELLSQPLPADEAKRKTR
jgi:hypothetical protein